jgi:hypothetical protein
VPKRKCHRQTKNQHHQAEETQASSEAECGALNGGKAAENSRGLLFEVRPTLPALHEIIGDTLCCLGPFAHAMNAATKYVATHQPDSLGWGPVEDLGADVMAGVRRVKSPDGPDLIV